VDNFYLSAIVDEIKREIEGRTVAGISLSGSTLLFDFRLNCRLRLLVSLDRAAPALYLSSRDQLKSGKRPPSNFYSILREQLAGAIAASIVKRPSDRVVEIEFENTSAKNKASRASLVLSLTGRSANAYLLDHQKNLLTSLFEKPAFDPTRLLDTSAASLNDQIEPSISVQELLDRFFGAGSLFGPQLRNEFLRRCNTTPPAEAFRSLTDDLSTSNPPSLIYSRLPLDQITQQVITPKVDLLLSHIELVQAGGLLRNEFSSLSGAADVYFPLRSQAIELHAEYEILTHELSRAIHKRAAVIKAMDSDRARFGNPDELKQKGDLILANLANATFSDGKATVVDYYDPDQREIEIEIREGLSLEEAATDYFTRYRKARRALEAITLRERDVQSELDPLRELAQELERDPSAQRIENVYRRSRRLLGKPAGAARDKAAKKYKQASGRVGRWFRSSDGYEIAVGRNDRDNDTLTFKVARPQDLWLHAADYPGSHVIIRNPNRQEAVPHRTIAEAAGVAALYSQAKSEGKAAIHYTQKKFVSKPPRAKPGLVRLSSFKSILVEPSCKLERID
jgi:predicted ribosome quality control (RQC) complex YloA/Tae2 family protein